MRDDADTKVKRCQVHEAVFKKTKKSLLFHKVTMPSPKPIQTQNSENVQNSQKSSAYESID